MAIQLFMLLSRMWSSNVVPITSNAIIQLLLVMVSYVLYIMYLIYYVYFYQNPGYPLVCFPGFCSLDIWFSQGQLWDTNEKTLSVTWYLLLLFILFEPKVSITSSKYSWCGKRSYFIEKVVNVVTFDDQFMMSMLSWINVGLHTRQHF